MGSAIKQSLSIKFSVVIALMSLTIGFLIVFASYQIYDQQNIEQYAERGKALVNATAEVVDWDRIGHYVDTLEEDEAYEETLEEMRMLARSGGVEYLYVLAPVDEQGAVYVYDTDESEERLELGEYTDWDTAFGGNVEELLRGEEVEPFITHDEWGWLLCIYVPFYDSQGDFVGYLGVDYQAEKLVQEQQAFIAKLAVVTIIVAVVVTIIFMLILRHLVLKPINRIATAANSYLIEESDGEVSSTNSITDLKIETNDELQTLDESLKYMDSTIQEYIENLEHANRRAETDSMTGLLNRESFKDYATLLLTQEPTSTNAFMMIDLDNFKTVNDTYGHLVGDDVIEACVKEIRKMFRATDLVARMGGDEFAVFCRGPITFDNVEKRAEQLCDSIRGVRINEEISITISVGVVYFDTADEHTYHDLYLQADVALYEAKAKGRDGFVIKVI